MIGLSPHTGLAGVQRTEDRDLAEWPTAGAKALPGEEERRQERGGKWGAWESREKQRVKWGGATGSPRGPPPGSWVHTWAAQLGLAGSRSEHIGLQPVIPVPSLNCATRHPAPRFS